MNKIPTIFTPKIYIASSEEGFDLKTKIIEYLVNKTVVDVGPHTKYTVDSVIYACMVAELVLEDERHCGILISETANDMVIMANRFKGIRAVIVTDDISVQHSKKILNSNIFCMSLNTEIELIEKWFNIKNIYNEKNMRTIYLMDSLHPIGCI